MFSFVQNQNATNLGHGVDLAFYVIFGISIVFLIGITITMVWFVVRYRRSKHPKAVQVKEHTWLEVTWLVIPTIIVMVMFYYGYIAFTPMHDAPKDAMVVKVIGKMWVWEFVYPGNKVASELTLPVNKPVRLDMTSVDVIHSLFIPAFRVKEDVVPGDTTNIWFIPQREGTYEILCTEYCGLRHSYMEAKAKIVSQADYDAWLAGLKTQGEGEPEGLAILKKNACLGCHSLDGTKLVGPTFKGIFGKKETVIENGSETEITADSLYIISSILEPDKQVVKGFNKGLMRTYKGVIPDDEIMKAYQYLKTLNAE